MTEEFLAYLENARKKTLEEKVNAFGDIVEKIMTILLKIPDLVDQQISNLQTRVNAISNDLSAIKTRGVTSPIGPGGPPPPPEGPPGGPPPPPAKPSEGQIPARPASPLSLRGAIMGELKQLFARRRQ